MWLEEQVISQLTLTNVVLGCFACIYLKFINQIGPFWGSVTRLWTAWHDVIETELPAIYALTKKYGPVVRITPTLLQVSDPTKLPEIYHWNADRTGHYIVGSFRETESLFNMRSHKTHASFRKYAAGPRMEPLIDLRIHDWINMLDEKYAHTGEIFDFSWWAVFMAYDVISEVGFGAPFGFVKSEDVGGVIQGFHDVDFLQTFLDARTENGEPLTTDYIKAEILIGLFSGADTVGTAFQAMVHYLLSNLGVYERMMGEVDTAFQRSLIGDDMSQYMEIMKNLPFFVACVRETLRMCPPVPNIFPRYVSEPGLELYGKLAPVGTEISGHSWIMNRDEKIFGKDVEEFNPDRWMNPEQAKIMNKYLTTFGYGARGCLGRDIAMMELFKGPLQFFRHSKASPVQGKPEAKFVVKGGVGFWRDMWVTIDRCPLVKAP
ncbi:cytochrome P450 [Aspergillus varians]